MFHFSVCLSVSINFTDPDGSEYRSGNKQTGGGIGVSLLQEQVVIQRGWTERRAHRAIPNSQLPWRAEEPPRSSMFHSSFHYMM